MDIPSERSDLYIFQPELLNFFKQRQFQEPASFRKKVDLIHHLKNPQQVKSFLNCLKGEIPKMDIESAFCSILEAELKKHDFHVILNTLTPEEGWNELTKLTLQSRKGLDDLVALLCYNIDLYVLLKGKNYMELGKYIRKIDQALYQYIYGEIHIFKGIKNNSQILLNDIFYHLRMTLHEIMMEHISHQEFSMSIQEFNEVHSLVPGRVIDIGAAPKNNTHYVIRADQKILYDRWIQNKKPRIGSLTLNEILKEKEYLTQGWYLRNFCKHLTLTSIDKSADDELEFNKIHGKIAPILERQVALYDKHIQQSLTHINLLALEKEFGTDSIPHLRFIFSPKTVEATAYIKEKPIFQIEVVPTHQEKNLYVKGKSTKTFYVRVQYNKTSKTEQSPFKGPSQLSVLDSFSELFLSMPWNQKTFQLGYTHSENTLWGKGLPESVTSNPELSQFLFEITDAVVEQIGKYLKFRRQSDQEALEYALLLEEEKEMIPVPEENISSTYTTGDQIFLGIKDKFIKIENNIYEIKKLPEGQSHPKEIGELFAEHAPCTLPSNYTIESLPKYYKSLNWGEVHSILIKHFNCIPLGKNGTSHVSIQRKVENRILTTKILDPEKNAPAHITTLRAVLSNLFIDKELFWRTVEGKSIDTILNLNSLEYYTKLKQALSPNKAM